MATLPKIIASDLADAVFEPKTASVFDPADWPLHFVVAAALKGTVKPFDRQNGPYIRVAGQGDLFIYSNDGTNAYVYNSRNKKASAKFDMWGDKVATVVSKAAHSVLSNPKTASLLIPDDHPSDNTKLQRIMGDPLDQPISAFAQYEPNPGSNQIANPLSPIQGDAAFFAYMIPGAVFQSHDGHQWEIESYDQGSYNVELYDRWYPRVRANVSLDAVRRSIHSWVEPIQQVVPPPPKGVSYTGQPVRIVN
jgi:hypothetical protein